MSEPSCDLCRSTGRKVLYERARTDDVTNVVCIGCGHVYVYPPPNFERHEALYAGGEFSDEARGGQPSPAKFAQSEMSALRRYRRLRWHCRGLAPGHAREVGCGLGSWLALMARAGWSVEGFEPDPRYAEAGELRYGIPIHAAMYESAPPPADPCTLIASFHVIEHVPSPSAFVQKVADELEEGGLLYLETPSIDRPYRGDLDGFFWSAHVHTFSHGTLHGLMSQYGLSVVRSGFADDFMWTIARRDSTVTPHPLPYRDPEEVIRTIRAWKGRHDASSDPSLVRVLRGIGKVARKATDEPSDFLPSLRRRLRR